ncbi:hypothetical protein FDECE_3572 [Fusarium decemcellulare]|nr:hypothetical protein FDECE_3572 [Fusarium decemcellulare]
MELQEQARDDYFTLDERQVRILILEPGRYGDQLVCELATVELGDDPEFEALSYCWGDKHDVRHIIVNGHPWTITKNLHSALQRLRFEDRHRRIWADAICINQTDDIEKSHQVNLMKDIFTRATGTTLFIGDYQDDSEQNLPSEESPLPESRAGVETAFDLIRKLAADHHIFYLDSTRETTSLPSKSFETMYSTTLCLKSIVEQPWWSRMWTVQEAVLPASPTVQYGAICADFQLFSRAITNMEWHFQRRCCGMKSRIGSSEESPVVTFYNKVGSVDRRRFAPLPLATLLSRFRDRTASDPRDMVYGVLGLAHDEATRAGIEADYTIGTVDLYVQTTRKLIALHGDLRPLFPVQHFQGNRLDGLPSWVPDYSLVGDWEYYSTALSYSHAFWQPVDFKEIRPEISRDSYALNVQGIAFDEIIAMGDAITPCPRKEILAVLDKWIDLLKSLGYWKTPYPMSEGTYEENMWLILCRGLVWLGGHSYRIAAEQDRKLVEDEWPEIPNSRPVNSDLQLLYWQRFFITRTGYIGLASPDIEVGDVVHLFTGGKTPFILRRDTMKNSEKLEHQWKTFSLISVAFVVGIMQGGLLRNAETEGKLELIALV